MHCTGCTHTRTGCTHTHTHTHTHLQVGIQGGAQLHAGTNEEDHALHKVYTHTHIHTYTHTHIHTYSHKNSHTRTHMYEQGVQGGAQLHAGTSEED